MPGNLVSRGFFSGTVFSITKSYVLPVSHVVLILRCVNKPTT